MDTKTKTVTFQPGGIGIKYSGSMITEVVEGSQAEEAGVQVGWLITHVNKEPQPDDTAAIDDAIDKTYLADRPSIIKFQKLPEFQKRSAPTVTRNFEDNHEM